MNLIKELSGVQLSYQKLVFNPFPILLLKNLSAIGLRSRIDFQIHESFDCGSRNLYSPYDDAYAIGPTERYCQKI